MSNSLPITLQMGALPASVMWTPQELADAIASRLSLQTAQSFALFVAGSTAPGSDYGPWWKDNSTWYRWDTGSGQYVPMTLESSSLGYFIGSSAPDPTVYQFWIETTAGGSPLALKIYYSGSWVDVYATTLASYLTIASAAALYQPLNANLTTLTTSTLGDIVYASATNTFSKLAGNTTTTRKFLRQTGTGAVSAAPAWDTLVAGDIPDISATYLTVASAAATYQTQAAMASYSTTAQMNTAISNAVAVVGQGSFSARPSGTQNVVFGGAGNQTGVVTLGTEDFDPDSRFASNTFTAPANGYYHFNFTLSVSTSGGSPTQLDIIALLGKNGSAIDSANTIDGAGTVNGGIFTGSVYLSLAANDTIDLRYDITSDAAVTAEINADYTRLSGYRVR